LHGTIKVYHQSDLRGIYFLPSAYHLYFKNINSDIIHFLGFRV
jgi:hypothetical protein